MRRLGWLVFQTAIVAVVATSVNLEMASAQLLSMSGNTLYDNCTAKNPENTEMHVWLCMGYTIAILDAMRTGSLSRHKACIPDGVKMQQIVDILKDAIQSQPNRRHVVAIELASEALERAFPCSVKTR